MFTLIIEDKHGAIVDEYSFEDGEFVIGRSQSCDIVLAADNVSRRHARLYTVEGRCYFEDLSSANGAWLNGKRIHNVTELPRSAQVRIGDFFLHIEGAAFARPLGSAVFARLMPLHGSVGEVTELNRATMLVGRGKDCSIIVSDPSISRIHSKFTRDPAGRVVLEDLRSSNGTYVNERRIEVCELQHGDRVRFGTVGFVYQVEGEEEIEPLEDAYPPAPPPAAGYRASPPISSYGDDYNYSYDGAAAEPAPSQAYPVEGGRTLLPQVAALAIIALAVTGLVALVGLAYDRWVSPALEPTLESAAPVTAAPTAATQEETEHKEFKDLVARGREAVEMRQWDQAESLFKKARRLDPISEEPIRAVNRIATEKRAGAEFHKAEEAFARKAYEEAIQHHRRIPASSVYRADADVALKSIAGVLEIEGENLCRQKQTTDCLEKFRLALRTDFASPELEKKYLKLLKDPKSP